MISGKVITLMCPGGQNVCTDKLILVSEPRLTPNPRNASLSASYLKCSVAATNQSFNAGLEFSEFLSADTEIALIFAALGASTHT